MEKKIIKISDIPNFYVRDESGFGVIHSGSYRIHNALSKKQRKELDKYKGPTGWKHK